MLSIQRSNGHAWLPLICSAITVSVDFDGHLHDEFSVKQVFAVGEDWAREKGHSVPDDVDFATIFTASCAECREPDIPEFMRRYCAHVTGTAVLDEPATMSVVATEPET